MSIYSAIYLYLYSSYCENTVKIMNTNDNIRPKNPHVYYCEKLGVPYEFIEGIIHYDMDMFKAKWEEHFKLR